MGAMQLVAAAIIQLAEKGQEISAHLAVLDFPMGAG